MIRSDISRVRPGEEIIIRAKRRRELTSVWHYMLFVLYDINFEEGNCLLGTRYKEILLQTDCLIAQMRGISPPSQAIISGG